MGTRGLEIVRFRGRYFIRYHRMDSYYEMLGTHIVSRIPADPKRYQAWLERTRAWFAQQSIYHEALASQIFDNVEKKDYCNFATLPQELPQLSQYGAEFVYIIDLDREVLTMNHTIHWKLNATPLQDKTWLQAIKGSVYPGKSTVSLDVVAEENMVSLALELPPRNADVGYASQRVVPKIDIGRPGSVFLAHVLAGVFVGYKDEIISFAREWSPSSFPFRELAFALVSISSGQATFQSLSDHNCKYAKCNPSNGRLSCIRASLGRLSDEWAGKTCPLLEFGSMVHPPGQPPGVSPLETTYWLNDVLVTLALVPDGKAVSKAVAWGIEQGRFNFQIVVLSLFEAVFAEVTLPVGGVPFVKISDAIRLSPLRMEYCVSTHPRDRPELKPGMPTQYQPGEEIMKANCISTPQRLHDHFPGLTALVSFFDVAASRRATSKTAGRLPTELYDHIVDHVNLETWKHCLEVSTEFRACCLRKFRLDHRRRIVGGPFDWFGFMSFDFEDTQTGEITPMRQFRQFARFRNKAHMWHPLVGSGWKALMLDVAAYFEPVRSVPVAAGSNDDAI